LCGGFALRAQSKIFEIAREGHSADAGYAPFASPLCDRIRFRNGNAIVPKNSVPTNAERELSMNAIAQKYEGI
jgi:hypothetical protein